MKRIRYLLIFVLILFLPINISSAKEVPKHDSNYFVDELGVLSETSKKTINGQQLPDGAQIFILLNEIKGNKYEKGNSSNSFVGKVSNGIHILINFIRFLGVFAIFIIVYISLVVYSIINGIIQKINRVFLKKRIKKMTYEDLLNYKRKVKRNSDLYSLRLEELLYNRSTEGFKRDIERASSLRNLFEEEYVKKKTLDLNKEDIKKIINDSQNTDYTDYNIYTKVVEDKIKRLKLAELEDLISTSALLNIYPIIKNEYTSRKRKGLSKLSIDDLLKARASYKDEYLNKKEIENIIDDAIKSKLKDMTNIDLEKILNNNNIAVLSHLVAQEQKRRETEEMRRHSSGGSSSGCSGGLSGRAGRSF